jgi:hypothetical protein
MAAVLYVSGCQKNFYCTHKTHTILLFSIFTEIIFTEIVHGAVILLERRGL